MQATKECSFLLLITVTLTFMYCVNVKCVHMASMCTVLSFHFIANMMYFYYTKNVLQIVLRDLN